MAKYHDIAEAIRQRIRHGDYRLRGLPSHAGLVAELGVNSRTVSRAISTLVDRGELIRSDTGRLLMPRPETATRHLGFLMAPWPSAIMLQWYRLIQNACEARGWSLRNIIYTHWHDTVITEAVRGMDGLFILSIGDDFPTPLLDTWREGETPVVLLEQDVSAHGLPCLRCNNPASIQQLIAHLQACGANRVHCLNTQPDSSIIRERIDAWHLWAAAHGMLGELVNEPVPPYSDTIDASIPVSTRLLQDHFAEGDAVLAITAAVALGAIRSATNLGLKPGIDVPIVSVDDWAGRARSLTPSLTSLKPPDIDPLVQVCLDYMDRGRDWLGPLLLQPPTMDLFVGETTSKPVTGGI